MLRVTDATRRLFRGLVPNRLRPHLRSFRPVGGTGGHNRAERRLLARTACLASSGRPRL